MNYLYREPNEAENQLVSSSGLIYSVNDQWEEVLLSSFNLAVSCRNRNYGFDGLNNTVRCLKCHVRALSLVLCSVEM